MSGDEWGQWSSDREEFEDPGLHLHDAQRRTESADPFLRIGRCPRPSAAIDLNQKTSIAAWIELEVRIHDILDLA